jgi:hypothetical protein
MKINFEKITLREQISHRGGGIEISLNTLGYPDVRMTAYQNYLGGGLLGRVGNDCSISDWRSDKKLVKIATELSKYFHSLTNPDTEWESQSFEQNQKMPYSGY